MLFSSDVQAPVVPTIASALTVAAVVAQGIWAHMKGRHGKRESSSAWSRIEKKIDGFDEKLDGVTEEHRQFALEQRDTNAELQSDIREVSAHVIGPDGRNGLRSRVERIEKLIEGAA